MMVNRRKFLQLGAGVGAGMVLPLGLNYSKLFAATATGILKDASLLIKYLDPLPIPALMSPSGSINGTPQYIIAMTQFTQQLHQLMAPTTLWGYNGSYPGNTIAATMGKKIQVNWTNNLPLTHMLPVDKTLHGADMGAPEVRNVVHLHGGHVPSESDGLPENWYVPGGSANYLYPNVQPGTTLWYHDHALGITRLNIYAGLAGFYIINDPNEDKLNLPKGKFDIPLLIQDRSFDTADQLYYPSVGVVPAVHPQWVPEFFGDAAVVNGKVWPYLEVEPRKYRFRCLNGSSARFYNLGLSDGLVTATTQFQQIGSDGGLLVAPVSLRNILMAPAERCDIVIDFSGQTGKTLTLTNNAAAPYPNGVIGVDAPAIPELMQFRVTLPLSGADTSKVPGTLGNISKFTSKDAVVTRDITLEERLTPLNVPLTSLINGKHYLDAVTETPKIGTIEMWRFINLTGDAHPIHVHLVQFQIIERRPFQVNYYIATQTVGPDGVGAGPTGQLVFTGPAVKPDLNERGWKDTVRANPGEVTSIIAKWEHYPGKFVYHCHILEHEDNDMMRPIQVML